MEYSYYAGKYRVGKCKQYSDINKPISNAAQQAINVLRLEGNFEHIQTELRLQLVDKHTECKKYPSVTVIGIDGEYEGSKTYRQEQLILSSAPLRGTATFN
jgi:hypothetical protein